MKKLLISTLSIIIIVVITFITIFYYNADENNVITTTVVNPTTGSTHTTQEIVVDSKKVPLSEVTNKGTLQNTTTETDAYVSPERFRNILNDAKKSGGVLYISIKDIPDSASKNEIKEALENLKKYGNMTGGKLTSEFKNINAYKENLNEKGISNILDSLMIKPTLLNEYLDNSFKLSGAAEFGGYTENEGFDSLYQLYESSNGRKIEMKETFLIPDESAITIIQESLNNDINGTPITNEVFDGYQINKIRFISNNKRYEISSMNMSNDELLNIGSKIINQKN